MLMYDTRGHALVLVLRPLCASSNEGVSSADCLVR